jgi:hypothetical protein
MVLVQPVQLRLGLGQREAVGTKRRVARSNSRTTLASAPPREREQAAGRTAAQQLGTAPDPVLLLGRGQGVQVQDHIPLRLGLAEALQRGAPPQAAGVLLVAPEVVEPVAPAHHRGDAFLGIQDGLQALAGLGEAGFGLQQLAAGRVVLAHPVQGALALHIFQPQEGVFGIGEARRLRRVWAMVRGRWWRPAGRGPGGG